MAAAGDCFEGPGAEVVSGRSDGSQGEIVLMKLSKLPDRTPVKLSMTLTPILAARLRDYAEFYAETYGTREEVADLVPFMLEAFLDGDADFKRASRAGGA